MLSKVQGQLLFLFFSLVNPIVLVVTCIITYKLGFFSYAGEEIVPINNLSTFVKVSLECVPAYIAISFYVSVLLLLGFYFWFSYINQIRRPFNIYFDAYLKSQSAFFIFSFYLLLVLAIGLRESFLIFYLLYPILLVVTMIISIKSLVLNFDLVPMTVLDRKRDIFILGLVISVFAFLATIY